MTPRNSFWEVFNVLILNGIFDVSHSSLFGTYLAMGILDIKKRQDTYFVSGAFYGH